MAENLLNKEADLCWQTICAQIRRNIPLISGERTGWRGKAKLAVQKAAIGLYRRGTHEVVDLSFCPDHHPSINQAIGLIRNEVERLGILPYDERSRTGLLRYIQCFVCRASGKVQLVLVGRELGRLPDLAEKLWGQPLWHSIWINLQPDNTNTIFGEKWIHCFGPRFLVEKMGRADVAFHPGAFAQANLTLFDRLLEKVESWVPERTRLLEIYAGAGGISLDLQPHLESAVLVEDNPYAFASFQQSAPGTAFRYVQGDASAAIPHIDAATCIIVDPPRKGLDPALLTALKGAKGKTLIYISCSTQSFLRDAGALTEAGWKIVDASLYWLFPGTDHIEIAAKFEKKSG